MSKKFFFIASIKLINSRILSVLNHAIIRVQCSDRTIVVKLNLVTRGPGFE